MMPSSSSYYIGLMSGTSLDGVDGVLVEVTAGMARQCAAVHLPFSGALREMLFSLQVSGWDELHREALAANQLVVVYANCVKELLVQSGLSADRICAIGAHGQTVRHRPELGYSRQLNHPALLAELTGINVVADFRSRDIAAGGQGAPLVPAYHHSVFGVAGISRVVVNIGGISNISILRADGSVIGFDTGPGNVLMDAWVMQHHGQTYDNDGAWARGGKVIPDLLHRLNQEFFLRLPPPKSTGRDLFNPAWLAAHLVNFSQAEPIDVQATLCVYTATTLIDAILMHAPDVQQLFICGGGAYNSSLMDALRHQLVLRESCASLESTAALGVAAGHVEALAFAWLAERFMLRLAGNLPEVTGATGMRVLGALYPR
jgi:anhydro-N-acetylmuramic acid kinase